MAIQPIVFVHDSDFSLNHDEGPWFQLGLPTAQIVWLKLCWTIERFPWNLSSSLSKLFNIKISTYNMYAMCMMYGLLDGEMSYHPFRWYCTWSLIFMMLMSQSYRNVVKTNAPVEVGPFDFLNAENKDGMTEFVSVEKRISWKMQKCPKCF